MKIGDLVKVRRMSGLYKPLLGMIVEIKKDEYNCVAIVKPFSGPIQPAHPSDVEVISASR
tara:strand:+ start:1219 stop:1398 length:180 start_codon:yes stop_codon:yes gene_type:complete